MDDIAYRIEYTVEVDVDLSFVWNWRTDVRNWHDPPARFELAGPFERGTWGTTIMPGQEPVRWRLRDVLPERCFIVEIPFEGATLSFEWWFEAIPARRTRMTQRIVLSGVNATAHVEGIRAGFGSTLADGMKRIAESVERAARSAEIGAEPTPLLFSYGTLQQEDVQLTTFGRRLHGQREELAGFEQAMVAIEKSDSAGGKTHHANVIFTGRNDSRVSGTAYEVTAAELAAADEYERPAKYRRILVRLASGRPAWVYVHAPHVPPVVSETS